ncbi:MAG: hypothetical protein R3195_19705 [Gemmatimonadota bacterium]|nr:hypothetical protein [Gemmatimonadota bacterium]
MNRKVLPFVTLAAAVVLGACESSPESPAAPEPASPDVAAARSVAAPDRSDPTSFVHQVGERAIVCKQGPSHAGFWVTEGGTTRFVEIEAGECAVVFTAEGATRTVEIKERIPRGQRLESVRITRLTCGRGLGSRCDGSSPAIEGPDAATNPVTGFVGGSGPSGDPSEWGLAGFVAEFTNSFVPANIAPKGEQVTVCLRGPARGAILLDDGTESREIQVRRGCQPVYTAEGATRTVSIRLVPPAGWRVAQVFQSQLTCGLGAGLSCDPTSYPVRTGPTEVSNPAVGFVGGSGPSRNPSQMGLSGFVVEFFNVAN